MIRALLVCFWVILADAMQAQPNDLNTWIVVADDIDPSEYYGVTSGNGMIGLVSSHEPLKVSDVILNGVYDYYQRGRVSNILKGFNQVNMNLDIDGHRMHS
jgi:hypothetical protein